MTECEMNSCFIGQVVEHCTDAASEGLRGLQAEPQGAQGLQRYLSSTRLRFVRLLALLRWVQTHGSSAEKMLTLHRQRQAQQASVEKVARGVWQAASVLSIARAPRIPVEVALGVQSSGSYDALPLCVRELVHGERDDSVRVEALDALLRRRVGQERLADGTTVLVEDGELTLSTRSFEAVLSVLDGTATSPWLLLGVTWYVPGMHDVTVGEVTRGRDSGGSDSPAKRRRTDEPTAISVHPAQTQFVLALMRKRLQSPETSLVGMITIANAFSAELIVVAFAQQAKHLCRTRWLHLLGVSHTENKLELRFWPRSVGFALSLTCTASTCLELSVCPDTDPAAVPDFDPRLTTTESLLLATAALQASRRLQRLARYLRAFQSGEVKELRPAGDGIVVLLHVHSPSTYPIPCELLRISVDLRSGRFLLRSSCPILDDELLESVQAKAQATMQQPGTEAVLSENERSVAERFARLADEIAVHSALIRLERAALSAGASSVQLLLNYDGDNAPCRKILIAQECTPLKLLASPRDFDSLRCSKVPLSFGPKTTVRCSKALATFEWRWITTAGGSSSASKPIDTSSDMCVALSSVRCPFECAYRRVVATLQE